MSQTFLRRCAWWLVGLSLLVGGIICALNSGGQFHIAHEEGKKVAVSFGGKLLAEYRYDSSLPKPYVHPVKAVNGAVVTLDSPADHKHHRGLFIGWSNVNGLDFWGESTGRMVHQRFERIEVKKDEVTLVAVIQWVKKATGEVILTERRTLRFLPPTDETTMLVWESELEADKEVTLAGAQYNGLGIRFPESMTGGKVLNSNGTTELKKANGEKAEWCAYFGRVNGSQCCVAIFSHPSNARHPTPFFVMNEPFGFLSAAPTFYQPLKLAPKERLQLRYLIVTYLGEAPVEKLRRFYQDWVKTQ